MADPFQEALLNPMAGTMTNQFGIYVHVPFCVHKCSYCDFYSFTQYQTQDFSIFGKKLIKEIREAANWLRSNRPLEKRVTSIFFGGGTPSLLPISLIKEVFEVLRGEFDWDEKIEITLEANPETVSLLLAQEWKSETPINRISMGAQSFQNKYLKTLERLGSSETIVAASENLKRAGFSNFNLDLIIGIPEQSSTELEEDIQRASALGPTHISNYNLTLKPGHALFRALPDGDKSADLYESARLALEKNGFHQYEISNYAKVGFECSHNLLYWSGNDFLGVGPSAASRFFWDGVFHHRKQLSDHVRYLKQENLMEVPWEVTNLNQTRLEALFLELRRNKGIDIVHFQNRYGLNLLAQPKLHILEKEGFLEVKEPTLRLTDKGRLIADSLVCELID